MGHVLILGATSDMAKALAYKYASEGFNLMLAARHSDRLTEVVSDLQIRYTVEVAALEFNALDYQNHADFYQSLPNPPEIAICVFGYLGNQAKSQTDFAEAEQIIATNYLGAVSILSLIANDFEAKGRGCIIGISSVSGDRGRGSIYTYGSAKAGMTAYLSGLRNRLAKVGVPVITVKPGFVRTKMTADLKLPPLITATPEQVAHDVYRAYKSGQSVVYTLWMWRFIMLIIRAIPEPIFKRLSL